jgi:glycerol-3-phosphate dehydrogenase (NAD(P)+)
MKLIAVIGAGSWGTALAVCAANAGHQVRLWTRNDNVIRSIDHDRTNQVYLPEVEIPVGVKATKLFADALQNVDFVILATPSHAMRSVLIEMQPALLSQMIFVSATKGIEVDSGKRMSEVLADVLKDSFSPTFVCVSGPSFAREVVAGHPTAVVAASSNSEAAQAVQTALSYENLRIYTNDDVVGTELGGSAKNVMAIAAGMVGGLGFGSNSIAALITRGLAEMTRLSVAAGARIETLMGLAGLGDLVLTCTGGLSRNRFVGQELGRGRSLKDIMAGMSEVAEGVRTTEAVRRLARRLNVEMPITEEVYQVLYEGKSPRDAAARLMNRPLRDEAR